MTISEVEREKRTLRDLGKSFIRKQRFYLLDDTEHDVFIYRRQEIAFAFTDPHGSILVNEKTLDYGQNVIEFVLLHEAGHQRWHPWLNWIGVPIVFVMLMAAFVFFLLFLLSIIELLWCQSHVYYACAMLPIAPPLTLLLISIPLFIVQLVFHISEGYADMHALSNLGETRYLKARLETAKIREKLNLAEKLYLRFRYPSPRLVIKLKKLLKSNPKAMPF